MASSSACDALGRYFAGHSSAAAATFGGVTNVRCIENGMGNSLVTVPSPETVAQRRSSEEAAYNRASEPIELGQKSQTVGTCARAIRPVPLAVEAGI